MADHVPDKRLTRRIETDIEVQWVVPRKGRFRTVEATEDARIVNVSSTGVGIRAASVPGLRRGSVVAFRCRGEEGEVDLRRIDPTDDPGESYFAAELIAPSHALIEALLGQTAAAPRVRLEDLWNRGS